MGAALGGDSDLAVLLFNAADSEKNITFKFDEHVSRQAQYGAVRGVRSGIVRDVWRKKTLGLLSIILQHTMYCHTSLCF